MPETLSPAEITHWIDDKDMRIQGEQNSRILEDKELRRISSAGVVFVAFFFGVMMCVDLIQGICGMPNAISHCMHAPSKYITRFSTRGPSDQTQLLLPYALCRLRMHWMQEQQVNLNL